MKASEKLLEIWKDGEESGVVSREHCKQIVGLTDNGNRSTLSIYKTGIPYFSPLLKVHKLKPYDII